MDLDTERRPAHLDHPALLYGNFDEFVGVTAPFIDEGFKRNEVVFVAARGDYLEALRSAVGGTGGRWHDTRLWHPHPATRLHAFYELVTDELGAGATGFRLVGEPVWPEGQPDLVKEWQRYESSLNAVLAPFPVKLLCLYDAVALDPSIVATARRTHPRIHEADFEGPSPDFEHPEAFLRNWRFDLAAPPSDAACMSGVSNLMAARAFVYDLATRVGVAEEPALDLVAAANEALSNAMVHGRDAPDLTVWVDGNRLLCQVHDGGPGIADPLVSYRPPGEGPSGRGLWMARQLVDFIQIEPGPRGTIVRLHVPIPG